jgi:hypothetical protein
VFTDFTNWIFLLQFNESAKKIIRFKMHTAEIDATNEDQRRILIELKQKLRDDDDDDTVTTSQSEWSDHDDSDDNNSTCMCATQAADQQVPISTCQLSTV